MTQLTDNGVFAYPVPEGCHSPYIINSANGNGQGLFFKRDGDKSPPYVVLPPGSYEFLFCTKGATEEDARKVVGSSEWFFPEYHIRYIDYSHPHDTENKQAWDRGYRMAINSLRSLLCIKGLDDKKNYALIRKV